MRLFLLLLLQLAAATFTLSEAETPAPRRDSLAPLSGMEIEDAFPNEHLVVFWDHYDLQQHFDTIGKNLSSAPRFKTFTLAYKAKLDDQTRDNLVRRDPSVRLVEANRPVYPITAVDHVDVEDLDFPDSDTKHRKRDYKQIDSMFSPYGLQMVTTPQKRLDIPVLDNGTYSYFFPAGQGVDIYIMDTGIRTTHELFGGRARHFRGLKSTDRTPYCDGIKDDTDGHGTHVAGIAGATKFGVAPHANLINVKVACSRMDIPHIRGAIIDIIAEHNRNKKKPIHDRDFWTFRGSVINMSFEWTGYAS